MALESDNLDREEREEWLLQQTTQRVLRSLHRELDRRKVSAVLSLTTEPLDGLRTIGAEIRMLERVLKLLEKGE